MRGRQIVAKSRETGPRVDKEQKQMEETDRSLAGVLALIADGAGWN